MNFFRSLWFLLFRFSMLPCGSECIRFVAVLCLLDVCPQLQNLEIDVNTTEQCLMHKKMRQQQKIYRYNLNKAKNWNASKMHRIWIENATFFRIFSVCNWEIFSPLEFVDDLLWNVSFEIGFYVYSFSLSCFFLVFGIFPFQFELSIIYFVATL